MRPVLAAAVGLGNARRPAELADPDDEGLVEEPARAEVIEERREPLVGRRHQSILKLVEVVTVGVPEVLAVVMPVDCDQTDARFDKSAAKQQALPVNVPAVAVA